MTADETIELAMLKAPRIIANGGGQLDFAGMMLFAKAIVALHEQLEHEKSHPFERLRAMGFVVNESEVQESDRLRAERNALRDALVEACAIATRWFDDHPGEDQDRIDALLKVGARE